jgi:hypothetical protein
MHRTKFAYYLLLKEFDTKFFSLAQDDNSWWWSEVWVAICGTAEAVPFPRSE